MKFNIKIFYLLLATALASSCQKDLDQFVPDPSAGFDSTWYNSMTASLPATGLRTALLLPIKRDSFELNNTTVSVITGSGLQCGFMPGSLVSASSTPVSGKIFIETHLLKKKGDLIRMGVPTTSNERLLVSGGAMFVRLTKNGSELHFSPFGRYYLSYSHPAPLPQMKLFDGFETAPGVFNWLPTQDSLAQVSSQGLTYQVSTNRLNWINCDQFYDTTGQARTILTLNLPANYTNGNSIAFTVFDDLQSVVGMYGNASTRKFSSGRLPANRPVTVVVISKQGNDYFLGHVSVTTTGVPGTINNQQVTVTPVISTLVNINAYLDSL